MDNTYFFFVKKIYESSTYTNKFKLTRGNIEEKSYGKHWE